MGFDWKRFVTENTADLAKKGKSALGKALEAGLNEAKKEVSSESVERLVHNVYAMLDNPQIANRLSDAVRSIDGDKINEVLQQFTAPFATEEGSMQLARILKQLQQAGQLDDMLDKLTDGTENLGMPQKFVVKLLMSGLEPVLKDVDSLSEEELAAEIRENFADLPTSDVADMVEALGRNITPETISALKHQATGKLPAPKTLANIFSEVLEAGIKRAEGALSNDNKKDATNFSDEVGRIVEENMKKDKKAKTKFGGNNR